LLDSLLQENLKTTKSSNSVKNLGISKENDKVIFLLVGQCSDSL